MKRTSLHFSVFLATLIVGWSGVGHVAHAASLFFSPASGTYSIGQEFSVSVKVNASSTAINSAEGAVTFSTDTLDLQSVTKAGTIFDFWTTQPVGANASGRIVFGGGLPSPGYRGSSGGIIRITFRVRAAGTASLHLTNGVVLANDGLGTNVLTSQGSATYTLKAFTPAPTPTPTPTPTTLVPPTLTVANYPDQNAWYAATSASAHWTLPAGSVGVSIGLSTDPLGVPDGTATADADTADITIPTDGIWYVHARAKYVAGWSDTVHYVLRHDTASPQPFSLELLRNRGAADPTPLLQFNPVDALSGVAHTTLSIDGDAANEVTSPVTLTLTKAGDHTVRVQAIDQAGNVQTATLTFSITGYPVPMLTSVSSTVILLERIHVEGTANAGDTLTFYLNGEIAGRIAVGTNTQRATVNNEPIRVPWDTSLDRVLRPGIYQLTVVAQGSDGQESVATDPVAIHVRGASVQLLGRPLATIAIAPVAGTVALITLLIVLILVADMVLWVIRMQRRQRQVRKALQVLRQRIGRERLSDDQISKSLSRLEGQIENHDVLS